jgi:hypothetical protein
VGSPYGVYSTGLDSVTKKNSMSSRHFVLSEAEFQRLVTTFQGAQEELEELIKEVDWYTSELPDRIDICLEILQTSEVPF